LDELKMSMLLGEDVLKNTSLLEKLDDVIDELHLLLFIFAIHDCISVGRVG
jgi:hypothetical protein